MELAFERPQAFALNSDVIGHAGLTDAVKVVDLTLGFVKTVLHKMSELDSAFGEGALGIGGAAAEGGTHPVVEPLEVLHFGADQVLGFVKKFVTAGPVEPVFVLQKPVLKRGVEPLLSAVYLLFEVSFAADDQFGGGGGGGRAEVGDKIADGEIDFVADGGDDRNVGGGDGAGDNFLVETPEIFKAAAATADDHDIHEVLRV